MISRSKAFLLASTLVTLVLIPVLYDSAHGLMDRIRDRVSAWRGQTAATQTSPKNA